MPRPSLQLARPRCRRPRHRMTWALVNPHSDLIFRVTDATSCRDCHAPVKGSPERLAVLDNGAVRGLIAKGKGAHGPGRFADCFRCHSGGRKGVEKYSDG